MKKESLFKYNYNILKKDKGFLFLLFAGFFIFYSFLLGLWKIPIVNFGIYRMSPITLWDYLFIFGTSVLISLFIGLWRHERKTNIQSNKIAGIFGGGTAGLLAGICPACQGLSIIALGTTLLNIPLAFLIPYLNLIKIISIGLLILVVYLKADSVYTKTCKSCLIISKQSKSKRLNS